MHPLQHYQPWVVNNTCWALLHLDDLQCRCEIATGAERAGGVVGSEGPLDADIACQRGQIVRDGYMIRADSANGGDQRLDGVIGGGGVLIRLATKSPGIYLDELLALLMS